MCNFNFEPLRNLIIYSAEFNGFFKPWLVFSFDQKTKKHKLIFNSFKGTPSALLVLSPVLSLKF
jgi:hypothetical protein